MRNIADGSTTTASQPICPLLDKIVLFAIIVLALIATLITALVIVITRNVRRGRSVRALLRDWMEEHEKREFLEESVRMFALSIIIKWLHLSSAAVLVGAVVVLAIASRAGLAEHSVPVELTRKLKMTIHLCLGVLLLTGLYNFWSVMQAPAVVHLAGYQAVFGIKFLLYIVVFALAIVTFRKTGAGPFSNPGRRLISGMALLCLLILMLSGFLNLERFQILTLH